MWRWLANIIGIYLSVGWANALLTGDRSDGRLSLLVAVPLTKNHVNAPDPGWIQLASTLMAIDHFNTRDSSVVPQLENLDCNITFGNITVVDTGTNAHLSMQELVEKVQLQGLPDAIAGPYNEIPAFELSVLATSLRVPIVAHRAVDYNLLLPEKHPFFSQVNADSFSEMEFLASYLNHTGRTNFIAVVYSSNVSVMQKADIFRVIMDLAGVDQVRTFSYSSHHITSGLPDTSIRHALEHVKATGFRTIVWISDDIQLDGKEIHEAASDLRLDQGNHLWVFMGGVAELSAPEQMQLLNLSTASFGPQNYLTGSAYLAPYEGFEFSLSRFPRVLFQQNKSFVERLESLTPIPNYYNWSYAATAENFTFGTILQKVSGWWMGTSYIYDATMAIGLGACEASATLQRRAEPLTGEKHLQGIRSVDFMGATGRIAFKSLHSGVRKGSTVPFAVSNLLPPRRNDTLAQVSEILDPSTSQFIEFASFVFADGTNHPPAKLRDTPEQNYLPPGVRAFGLSLMSIAFLVIFLSVVWVFLRRHHSVVIAAQPPFLYALCLGSAVTTINMWLISNDESYGWDTSMLDKSCVASVWISTIGELIIYGALFTKHWRVNRLICHKTNHISLWRVLWPCMLFGFTLISILWYWTATSEYGWQRKEIDDVTGENIGQCSGGIAPLLYIVMLLFVIPVVLAGVMAYKTLGVDDHYSEGKWVLTFILVQLQVWLIGAPLTQILKDFSTEGSYIGVSLVIWTVPMSTMGLIVLPKVLTVRRIQRNANSDSGNCAHLPQPRSSQTQSSRESADLIAPEEENQPVSIAETSPATPLSNGPRMQIVTFD